MKKRILFIVLGVIVVVASVFLFMSRKKSSNSTALQNVAFLVSGYTYDYTIRDNATGVKNGPFPDKNTILALNSGNYDLIFSSTNRDDIRLNITVPESSSDPHKIEFKTSAVKTLSNTPSIDPNTSAAKETVRYFANQTWSVTVPNTTDINVDTDTDVTVSKKIGQTWKIVESGTYIDASLLRLDGAPQEVIDYMDSLQR